MKTPLIGLSAVVAALFTTQVTVAQDASTKTRAEVKSEAASANKSGTIEKGPAVPKATKPPVDKSRSEVKTEAASANQSGTIEKGAAVPKTTKPATDKTRAEVKAEAAAANKAGTIEKGAGSLPPATPKQ